MNTAIQVNWIDFGVAVVIANIAWFTVVDPLSAWILDRGSEALTAIKDAYYMRTTPQVPVHFKTARLKFIEDYGITRANVIQLSRMYLNLREILNVTKLMNHMTDTSTNDYNSHIMTVTNNARKMFFGSRTGPVRRFPFEKALKRLTERDVQPNSACIEIEVVDVWGDLYNRLWFSGDTVTLQETDDVIEITNVELSVRFLLDESYFDRKCRKCGNTQCDETDSDYEEEEEGYEEDDEDDDESDDDDESSDDDEEEESKEAETPTPKEEESEENDDHIENDTGSTIVINSDNDEETTIKTENDANDESAIPTQEETTPTEEDFNGPEDNIHAHYDMTITPLFRSWIESKRPVDDTIITLPFILRDLTQVDKAFNDILNENDVNELTLTITYTDGSVDKIKANEFQYTSTCCKPDGSEDDTSTRRSWYSIVQNGMKETFPRH